MAKNKSEPRRERGGRVLTNDHPQAQLETGNTNSESQRPAEEIYTEEWVKNFSLEHSITDWGHEELKSELIRCAKLYRSLRRDVENATEIAKQRKLFEKIAQKAKALSIAFEGVDGFTEDLILNSRLASGEKEASEIFASATALAKELRSKGGQPERVAIAVWAGELLRLWSEQTGKEFKRPWKNESTGAYEGEAYVFLVEAIRPVDQHAVTSIPAAMAKIDKVRRTSANAPKYTR